MEGFWIKMEVWAGLGWAGLCMLAPHPMPYSQEQVDIEAIVMSLAGSREVNLRSVLKPRDPRHALATTTTRRTLTALSSRPGYLYNSTVRLTTHSKKKFKKKKEKGKEEEKEGGEEEE